MKKENQLYNSEIKEKFLEQYTNDSTRTIALYPLKRARAEEESRGKDLYEMDIEELSDVLSGFSSSTLNAVLINVSKIEDYIMWTAKNGYRKTNLSPFPVSDREEWCKQFIATYRNYSFTRQDVLSMADDLVNEVDQAVLLLLFEGVGGVRHNEILDLKISDLQEDDGKYTLKLTNVDKSTRKITISNELARVLRKADAQREYISKNGMVENTRYQSSELVGSTYIFKRTNRGRQGGRLNNFFVNRKIAIFKDVFGLEFLKAQHLSDSGIMHMAHEFHKKTGSFTADNAREIAEQFDTVFASTNEVKYRNVTAIRKIVESEDFHNLYGYHLNIDF